MAYDFPNSPTVGQEAVVDSKRYIWDGTAWNVDYSQGPAGPTGPTGPVGATGPTGPEASINAQTPLVFNSTTRELSAPTVTTVTQATAIAEAAAAAAVAAHNADQTDVHGILETWELETQSGAQDKATATADAKVLEHNLDTTNVHGIVDTNLLATEAEALSIATAEAAAQIETHRLDGTNVHGITDSSQLVYRRNSRIETVGGAAISPYDISTFSRAALHGAQHTAAAYVDLAPRRFNTTVALVSGVCWFHYFTPLETTTVTQAMVVGANPAASGTTVAKYGLYTVGENDAVTLVAKTNNELGLFEFTNSYNTASFAAVDGYPASYTLQAGQRYAFAVLFVGSVAPGVYLAYNNPPVIMTSLAPRMTAAIGSQTDLPTYRDNFSNTTIGIWARLS